LQEASTEVRDLYNNAPCGYHSLDDKGMITEMNHTGLQWLGYTRDEIRERKAFYRIAHTPKPGCFQEAFPRFKERDMSTTWNLT